MDSKYKYKYEVHMHTSNSSACGKTRGRDYIAALKAKGYDGVIITDHFFHGNTAADRTLPWEQFVDRFCEGYEEAKEEGDRQGFKVFFGWEENHEGDEYLIYGPDKEWLKAHPEILECTMTEQLRLVHEAGGAVVQAHPFRERGYLSIVNLHPFQCDAMEVCNFGNPPYQDILAYNFCKQRGILMTSGTDMHDMAVLDTTPAGMCFEKPLESIWDYAKAIRSGEGFEPLIPELRREPMAPNIVNTLPIQYFDEREVGHMVEIKDIFVL